MAGARSLWRATGMKDGDFNKPIIAISNSFTQFVPGHVHLKDLGQLALRLNRVVDVPGAQVTDGGGTVLKPRIVGDGRFGIPLQWNRCCKTAAAEPSSELQAG